MIFQRLNPQTVSVKTASAVVSVSSDGTLKVGDRKIEGPGEYDISGVGLHVFVTHAFVLSESIQFAIIWSPEADLSSDGEINQDVMLILLENTDKINTLVKEQDPRIVILADETIAETIAKQDGVELDRQTAYRVTYQTLPADTRVYTLLT